MNPIVENRSSPAPDLRRAGSSGFLLQWLLPVQVVADAKGMVGSIIGLVTLLLALVLGLLVWTSYGVYTDQNAEFAVARAGDPAARFRARAIWAGSACTDATSCERRSCARATGSGAARRAASRLTRRRAPICRNIAALLWRPQAGRRSAERAHRDREADFHSGHPDDLADEPTIGQSGAEAAPVRGRRMVGAAVLELWIARARSTRSASPPWRLARSRSRARSS